MIDLDWKNKMVVTPDMSSKSPKLSNNSHRSVPLSSRVGDLLQTSPSATLAYEQYLRLPDLAKLWSSKDFPSWSSETVIKPALQALEITFRLISIALSDPRPYANRCEWEKRLESLAVHQIELIAGLCEGDESGSAPTVDLSRSNGVLSRDGSSREVWTLPGETLSVVSRSSEASLLPRLATWQRSEGLARRIAFAIECLMQRSVYTLGLGEPNLSGKPNLEYDLVCRPSDLHSLKKSPKNLENYENEIVFTTHQILESWIRSGRELLCRIEERIEAREFDKASGDCWILERIWKLMSEIEDLHLLMDPDDFFRLKSQLCIKSTAGSEPFCFRSTALIEMARASKDLRRRVPEVLGVEVDPKGGPRIQEAAMKALHRKRDVGKIHLMQAFQAIEAATKRFFYAYWQLIMVVIGSLEAKGNRAFIGFEGESDPLPQMFLEPPYYPSLDAAKTFLGDFWQHEMVNPTGSGSQSRKHKHDTEMRDGERQ
eukprot:TRINITY_DN2746_c0_g1_i1.p1 TRINITY_DN2746_c0_g1~~TRINITY_DN2746_c0_g1_i1.p1  ORF type:complete len:486 (-),score=10.27 TRINITY_DN2746_c0_g1_i1:177-1634(-)